VFLSLLGVVGCSMGPDYVRPPVPEPEAYREGIPVDTSIANTPWWELFGDTVLQDLIETALENNRDLRTSFARIDEARATLGIVRADLFPRVNYFADGSAGRTTADDGDVSYDATAVLSASYIVDLWGRVRRSNEAALQELLATEEAYRNVTIALVAAVANAYLLLRDLDNRIGISERTLESREQSLDVVRSRFHAGMVSEVDVNQAEILVYEAQASVQSFERLRAQTENSLSLLLGVPPMSIERGLPLTEQVFPPELPTGLPSALLDRRPDILVAERQLHAQTARIGVAKALRFPQLDLLADLGGVFNGGNTGFLNLGAQIFGPLYNSGEFNRRVDVEVARTEQLLNQYEQTILTALREVDDALVAVRTYEVEYQARRRQVDSAANAAALSWVRYEGGLTSYLEVLDLERSLFSSQLTASLTLQLRLTSIVQLYQALGGGWVVEQDTLGVFGEE
jgi:multidrug efflux system outer membrane protein